MAIWAGLVALELGLAAGVALGSTAAAFGASALLAVFAVALGVLVARGKTGAPCACFGSRSKVRRLAVARNAALAAAFAAVPFVPSEPLGTTGWLTLGLVAALAGVLALTLAVLALAREVGLLRLQLPPQPALELADEGPPLGVRTPVIERFTLALDTELALAVFSSPGCPLCRTLAPAVEALARDPLVAVEVFDEEADPEVWRELAIPGSPFAVALDRVGVVRAKGTFNSFAQLESVLAAVERRTRESEEPSDGLSRVGVRG